MKVELSELCFDSNKKELYFRDSETKKNLFIQIPLAVLSYPFTFVMMTFLSLENAIYFGLKKYKIFVLEKEMKKGCDLRDVRKRQTHIGKKIMKHEKIRDDLLKKSSKNKRKDNPLLDKLNARLNQLEKQNAFFINSKSDQEKIETAKRMREFSHLKKILKNQSIFKDLIKDLTYLLPGGLILKTKYLSKDRMFFSDELVNKHNEILKKNSELSPFIPS